MTDTGFPVSTITKCQRLSSAREDSVAGVSCLYCETLKVDSESALDECLDLAIHLAGTISPAEPTD